MLSPAVGQFTLLLEGEEDDDVETAENFRPDLSDYVRKYGFLARPFPAATPRWNGCTSVADTS